MRKPPTLATRTACVLLAPAIAFGSSVAQPAEEKGSATPRAPVRVYTNTDIQRLPDPDIPSTSPDTPSDAPVEQTEQQADAAGEATTAAELSDALKWLTSFRQRLERQNRIAAAQRRVREALRNVARLEGSLRPKGSVFPEGTLTADALYVRGVTDSGNSHDSALKLAYRERAEARAELDRILAETNESE